MSIGFIMLAHTSLGRAAQSAKHFASSGHPVILHTDAKVRRSDFDVLDASLRDFENIQFTRHRHVCNWGMWGIVGATLEASQQLLDRTPDLTHVCLVSGSCLPLRPLPELDSYLRSHIDVDFIESVTIEDVGWSKGGFDRERFMLRFPFSFQKQRWMFDRYVALQRKLDMKRHIPSDLIPHLGSQWWCLTTKTLSSILDDSRRSQFDKYFRRVWIPDESYFQSLVRLHSTRVESRSLTLSKFDFQGRPHVFYDDHLQLLRRSDCFLARKIWPHADLLYSSFLSNDPQVTKNSEPNPGKIDRLFSKAADRRANGRSGLWMQSRYPGRRGDVPRTGERYSVFQGFSELFRHFEDWLSHVTGLRVHGHLFALDRVQFAAGATHYNGCLSDSAALRDYNPRAFLTNLLWATRNERQCFMFGPADRQEILKEIALDANAQISVVSGAWAIPLFNGNAPRAAVRKEAARLQRVETAALSILSHRSARAQVRVFSLAEFLEAPMENLQPILDEVAPRRVRRLGEAPKMTNLEGFGEFLQAMRNDGMNLYLPGDFASNSFAVEQAIRPGKPYVV